MTVAREAHWQMGIVERHVSMITATMETVASEEPAMAIEELLICAVAAHTDLASTYKAMGTKPCALRRSRA